ncbi:MAG: hypothetical protein WAM79_04575 [Candidatus Sulfotelmatobacter sp.]
MIERRAQPTVVVILDGNETEWLQHSVGYTSHRAQDFRHTMHGASLRLKGDFHEVSLRERMRQAKQASSGGDGLEFCFCAAAIF